MLISLAKLYVPLEINVKPVINLLKKQNKKKKKA